MRSVVYEAVKSLAVLERDVPVPGPKDVLIQTAAVGICGSDVHVFDGEFEGAVFPIVPGHEVTGIVTGIGSEVRTIAVGDRVAVNPGAGCGECDLCLVGKGNLCRDWNCIGVTTSDGASQEQFLAPVASVYRLSPGTDLNHAALIEPLSCAIRGYDQIPRRMGEHYLIYGAGTMGLLMAQLAPRAGAASVTIVDVNESRLEVARELGIETILASADQSDRVLWDVVIDCTGNVRAIQDGLPRVRPGGTFLHFGVAAVDATAEYSPFRVYRDEITIVGTMAELHSFGRAVEMFEAGAINPVPMISHSFTLEDYPKALEMFRAGTGRKLQIRPQDTESRVL